jgi:hypothetical protein
MCPMSVVDLTGRLKEAEEALEEASMSLQQDGKLYLTEEWDARRKKRKTENHYDGGAGKSRGRDGSSSGRSLNKPTDDEC